MGTGDLQVVQLDLAKNLAPWRKISSPTNPDPFEF